MKEQCCLCGGDYWVLYGDPDPGFCTFSCSEVYYERASLPPVVALDDSMLPF